MQPEPGRILILYTKRGWRPLHVTSVVTEDSQGVGDSAEKMLVNGWVMLDPGDATFDVGRTIDPWRPVKFARHGHSEGEWLWPRWER